MKSFLNNLVKTLNEEANVSYTENGALGYRQSGKALLDMNFRVSSYRNKSEEDICNDFVKAFYEDKLLALKWLVFKLLQYGVFYSFCYFITLKQAKQIIISPIYGHQL